MAKPRWWLLYFGSKDSSVECDDLMLVSMPFSLRFRCPGPRLFTTEYRRTWYQVEAARCWCQSLKTLVRDSELVIKGPKFKKLGACLLIGKSRDGRSNSVNDVSTFSICCEFFITLYYTQRTQILRSSKNIPGTSYFIEKLLSNTRVRRINETFLGSNRALRTTRYQGFFHGGTARRFT